MHAASRASVVRIIVASFLVLVAPARAADEPGPTAEVEHQVETDADAPLPPGNAPRPVPDYGGRTRESSASPAWWAPRLLLAPFSVATDMIGRPVAALMTLAEKNHWPERLRDFFTFGPEENISLFPVARIDLGFRPSAGVAFDWRNISGQSDLQLRATLSGIDAYSVHAAWAAPLGARRRLALALSHAVVPDRAFYGLGPSSMSEPSRYGERWLDARVQLVQPLGAIGALSSHVGSRWTRFDDDRREHGDDSLADAIQAGRLPPPPALASGFAIVYQELRADLDARAPRLTPSPLSAADFARRGGSGWSLAARVKHAAGVVASRASRSEPRRVPHWVEYHAAVTGALDLTGTWRVIELATVVGLVTPLPRDNPVPFTQQLSLGGERPLRAFRANRLTDLSAASITVRYRWPIWVYVDAAVHYGVGNVFGAYLEGFALERLRSSFGLAIVDARPSNAPFELVLAFGGEPFGDGGRVESFRFALGNRLTF